MATVSPLVICALLPLTFGIHYTYLKRRGEDFSPIVSRYVSMFLLITYTVLPSVCTTIFGAFSSCLNIDPEGLSGTYSLYLPKDLSISCNSSRYYYGVSWAAVMMIIYPLGIPCLYLYLLFLARAEIIRGKEKQITASSSKTLKVANRNSFLNSSFNSKNDSNKDVLRSSARPNLSNDINGRGSLSDSNNGRANLRNSISERDSCVNASENGIRDFLSPTEEPILVAVPPPVILEETMIEEISTKRPTDTGIAGKQGLEKEAITRTDSRPFLRTAILKAANDHAAKILSEEGMLKYIVNELEFLHRDYHSSYWYWEIVLTYHKLLLTAVLSIIYPGTNDQILIGWIMAFLMMRVQTMASPYLDHYDDSLKTIADYQVLLFLFITIIKVGNFVSGAIWEGFINVIMLVLIIWSPIAAFWYAFIAPSEAVANLRQDYREQKAKAILERQAQALKDAMSSGNLHMREPRSKKNHNVDLLLNPSSGLDSNHRGMDVSKTSNKSNRRKGTSQREIIDTSQIAGGGIDVTQLKDGISRKTIDLTMYATSSLPHDEPGTQNVEYEISDRRELNKPNAEAESSANSSESELFTIMRRQHSRKLSNHVDILPLMISSPSLQKIHVGDGLDNTNDGEF